MDAPDAEHRSYAPECSQDFCDGDHHITREKVFFTTSICDQPRTVPLTVVTAVVAHIAGMEDLLHVLEQGSQRLRTAPSVYGVGVPNSIGHWRCRDHHPDLIKDAMGVGDQADAHLTHASQPVCRISTDCVEMYFRIMHSICCDSQQSA